jgi:hypothetical protein
MLFVKCIACERRDHIYGLLGARPLVPLIATGAAGVPFPSMLPVNSATLALIRATRDSIA